MKTKPRIFVIEDDLDIQDLINAFFKPRNFEVINYQDAEEALAVLRADPQACDVVLTDFKLPHMSGLELTQTLRNEGVGAPIIIMTAHKTSELAIDAIRAGAYDFVVKPLHFPQLQVSVERALYLNKVHAENAVLKAAVAVKEGLTTEGIIGKSPKFLRALDLAKRVANSASSVLITGESGTGKEVFANAIHNMSLRKKAPFVAINCSAIPENLLESELFGYAKGAFTGATDKKMGLFEEADKGTLFLDEIGDLSLSLQAKLLRVLQERKIKRLGENQTRSIDVRVISATHKNLRQEIQEKRFREDLFFRLNVIPIVLPPLRERQEDILPLADFFLRKYSALNDAKTDGFSKDATEYLLKNPWRGNVRELENTVERAVVLASDQKISASDLVLEEVSDNFFTSTSEESGGGFSVPERKILPLDEVVNRYIMYALNINNGAKDQTARELSIDRKTLYRRVQEKENRATMS